MLKNIIRISLRDLTGQHSGDLIGKTGLDGEMKVRELSSGMNAKLRIAATLARKGKINSAG